jgi:hypothetical protein
MIILIIIFISFHGYKILSLSTISTPTPLDDLKECKRYPWITEYGDEDEEKNDENEEKSDEDEEENDEKSDEDDN